MNRLEWLRGSVAMTRVHASTRVAAMTRIHASTRVVANIRAYASTRIAARIGAHSSNKWAAMTRVQSTKVAAMSRLHACDVQTPCILPMLIRSGFPKTGAGRLNKSVSRI